MCKLLFILCFFLTTDLVIGQNMLELKILNDSIKKVSYYDHNKIIYRIKNNSDVTYHLILDDNEFNEDPDYTIEPFFVGLPDYYIYHQDEKLIPEGSFGTHSKNKLFEFDPKSTDFINFKKKYSNIFNSTEIKIAYRISKKIVKLNPKEEKTFVTTINFPNYKSRFFHLNNKIKYKFQISLHVPKEIISKYYQAIIQKEDKKIHIFSGNLLSNKIPLVYEVYNGF
ncbi:hypothetical protein [Chryseobacterium sp. RLHN22]|uniref:hypothetical protein n=1 Tax=Chryseobacterium sp. RLHN22 TaxID=3437885 RepID=UPI003D9B0B8E